MNILTRLFRYSFFGLLIALTFDVRRVFFDLIPEIEYARFSVYFSDFFLSLVILFGILLVLSRFDIEDLFTISRLKWTFIPLLLFFLFLVFSLVAAPSLPLGMYTLIRFGLLITLALFLGYALRRNIILIREICLVLALLAVSQALIGILQFHVQSDLGLRYFGESVLRTDIPGVAKIVYVGNTLLRAYGTLPHPNVFAAFLIIGFLAIASLWFSNKNIILVRYIFYTIAIFIVILGILLSFSRAAWMVLLFIILIFAYQYFRSFLSHDREIEMIYALFIMVVSSSLFFQVIIFYPLMRERFTVNVNEPAVTERVTYARIAFDEIRERPLLGVGIGNHVLYGVGHGLYQQYGMIEGWQWQPAHNIYLLIFSENGVFGFTSFLFVLLYLLIPKLKFLISKQVQNFNFQQGENIIFFMLVTLLILGFFDHFLWTLEQGRLLFWIVMGILIGILGARSSTDRMYPSEG